MSTQRGEHGPGGARPEGEATDQNEDRTKDQTGDRLQDGRGPGSEGGRETGGQETSLRRVLDQLLDECDDGSIRLSRVMEGFGVMSYGPWILVPAVLLTLPTGALPGVPLVLGAFILVVSVQLTLGVAKPWTPKSLGGVEISRERLVQIRKRAEPVLALIDRLVLPRAAFLVAPPMSRLIGLCCTVLSLALLPVEFIPFATAIPGSALILFGLALTVHDGVLALLGYAAMAGTGWFVYSLF